jgi:hypothetical protein
MTIVNLIGKDLSADAVCITMAFIPCSVLFSAKWTRIKRQIRITCMLEVALEVEPSTQSTIEANSSRKGNVSHETFKLVLEGM